MLSVIPKNKLWLSISGAMVIASLLAIFIWGLKPSIDFTGGSILEISYSVERPKSSAVQESLADLDLGSLLVQPAGERDFILRFEESDEETHQVIIEKLQGIQLEGVEGNTLQENRFESIGPILGTELRNKAIQSIIVVLILIILYIAYAFRKVPPPVASWKYGVAAVIALLHDVLFVVGVFAVLGKFANIEVDSLFVTALLTVLGFSVHDTIVTFDRTRENLFKKQEQNFDKVLNDSINETVWRSINTSTTTLLVLLAVFFFGGQSVHNFVLALILGIVVGTYSSIFVASPILSIWHKKSL